jgi:ABC-type branched-subunit amino acid transport system substrate-binding protein
MTSKKRDVGEAAVDSGRRGALFALGGASVALAGCSGASQFGGQQAAPPVVATAPQGPVLGQGSVSAALILPLSATGNAGRTAASMRQAAEMALAEFQNPDVRLQVIDDLGTPAGAQAAAQQAVAQNAQIILGPLFAPSVEAVGRTARERGIPVIAFSTDENVASRGVYLLSFLPSSDVQRITSYAAQQGKRNIAALVPDDAYGVVVDAEFRAFAPRAGIRIVALEKYPLDRVQMQDPIRRIVPALAQADALFIPDGADAVQAVLEQLRLSRAPLSNLKLLGTGRWDDRRLWGEGAANGAWYAAPDAAGFQDFAGRFRARFNADPVRTASLAYDATLLVAALTRSRPGPNRFTEQTLTDPNGFAGVDGVFRFRPNGTSERGIAVLEIRGGQVAAVSPAPRSFAQG